MHARAPIIADRKMVASAAWGEPLRNDQNKHARFIWVKRGGVGRQSGNGPSGCKATPRALLARTLAERAGVAAAVTTRQAARVEAKKRPIRIIYGKDEQ
jgi:hypothetical protein